MPKLFDEDQARVDEVLSKGVYRVERKPFKPWLLLLVIFVMLSGITAVSYLVAAYHGFL